MPSSLVFPPLECWRETSPSHAERSRPLRNRDLSAVCLQADRDEIAFKLSLHPEEVIGYQFVDQFCYPPASLTLGDEVGQLEDERCSIGHRYRAFTTFKKRMIVLSISDTHDFVEG